MPSKAPTRIAAALIAFAAGAMAVATSSAAQTVGVTSAVNPASLGAGKPLTIGAAVLHNERIDTNSDGSAQLLFLDRTTMVIGPNSKVVIDDYVYDTRTQSGHMAVTVTKGLLRFVGGQIAHGGNATIDTPTAVVGVRGGTAQLSVTDKGTLAIFLGANQPDGWLNVAHRRHGGRAGGVSPRDIALLPGAVHIIRAGFATQVGGGSSLPPPRRIDLATLNRLNALLTSRPGINQTGGVAANVSKGVQVIAQGTGGTVASNTILPTTPSVGGSTGGTPGTIRLPPVVTETIDTPTPHDVNGGGPTQSASPYAFALSMTNCCAPMNQTSPVPYLPHGFAFDANTVTSPVLGFRPANSDHALTLQYGFGFNQTGAGQNGWFYVATGAFVPDGQGGLTWTGGFSGSRRAGEAYHGGAAGVAFSSPAGSVQVDPVTGLPVSGRVDQNTYFPGFTPPSYADALAAFRQAQLFSGLTETEIEELARIVAALPASPGFYVPGQASYYPGTASPTAPFGSTQYYDFQQDFARITTPDGLGSYRPTVALTGRAAAIGEVGRDLRQWTGPMDLTLDGQNGRVRAAISSFDPLTFGTSLIIPVLANLDGSYTNSAYIDYDHFGARVSQYPYVWSYYGSNGGLVSVSAHDAQQIADQVTGTHNAVSFCQCDYTRWGFWSASDSYDVNNSASVPMGLWVAGRPTTAAEVPTTGVATYTGHAIADIANGSRQYLAAGNFSNTVNFASRSGSVMVNQLDGVDYAGTTTINANDPTTFVGNLSNGPTGRTMQLDGSFYRGTTSPVGEMGGQLTISGQNYMGAGIFAAKAQ